MSEKVGNYWTKYEIKNRKGKIIRTLGLHNLQGDKNIQEYHPNSRQKEAEFPKVGFLKPNKLT